MKITNILCPIDFSDHSHAALRYATSLAREYDAELHIVHVHDETVAYTSGGFSGYTQPGDVDVEKTNFEKIEPPVPNLKYKRTFIVGHPADELMAYATDNHVDLIVLGTHGRTGLSRLLMGSVAEAVVRRAACPVLTLKRPVAEAESEAETDPGTAFGTANP